MCGNNLGHAVLAIGYDNDPLYGDYVIIKNSHGRHWGELGYARISLTKDYGYKGVCGVLRESYYGSFDEL